MSEEVPLKKAHTCPKLKLYYFDAPALGEIIRLVCHYGNLPWEDVRLSIEEYVTMKESGKLAFGQVPALQVNDSDVFLFQSAAILRYVGKFAGLYPEDDVQAALCDALIDQEKDMFSGLNCSRYRERSGYASLSSDMVEQVRKTLNDEVLPRHLQYFENFLARSPSGWLLGGEKPTIADFVLALRVEWLVTPGVNDGIDSNLLESFPHMKALIAKVKALPEVVSYYDSKK
eukprot:scaffold15255_cov179-Ochromonas_danica.AAC.3